jgi:hypothetical protein
LKHANATAGVAIASIVTGLLTGQLWILGNRAAEAGIWWLVVLSIPANLVVAAVHYYVLRGAVHRADGGLLLLIFLIPVNLVISLGVASWTADAIGAGNVVKIGAHAFSWGMSFAYGQSFHDVRHGTWLHE